MRTKTEFEFQIRNYCEDEIFGVEDESGKFVNSSKIIKNTY